MEAHGDAGRPAELQAAELQAAELQRLLDAAIAAEDFAASLRAELRTKAVATEEARYAEELLRHNLRVAKVPKADPDPHPNPNPNLTLTPTPTLTLTLTLTRTRTLTLTLTWRRRRWPTRCGGRRRRTPTMASA